jgi:hypothetical protein
LSCVAFRADVIAPVQKVQAGSADSVLNRRCATHASTLTPASGQTMIHQYLDSTSHATCWTQKTKAIAAANTTVSVGSTIATTDHWNMATVEIPSATPPPPRPTTATTAGEI